jgi:hypothetical protein
VSHFETSVMGASLADYSRIQLLSVSLQSVACPASVLFVFAISFCFFRAYDEFGSPGSLLSCNESVLCCTWLPSLECAASWHEDFAYAGFICFRGGWSVALMLRTELFIGFYARVLFLWL